MRYERLAALVLGLAADIAHVKVLQTVVRGRIVYQREGFP